MDHVRRGFVVATAVSVTVLAAGCSAGRPAHRSWQATADEPTAGAPLGNQVDSLDPAAILQRAQAATAGAKSVHVKGEVLVPGGAGKPAKPFTVDMRFTAIGSAGQIVEDGTTADVTRVQNQVWFRGDAKFWSNVGTGADVAGHDKYVQVPSGDKRYGGIVENTYVERLTNKLMGKPGKLDKGPTRQVNGHRAIALENRTPGTGGTIWVATEGPPYLLRMEAAADAKQPGAFDFLGYGERVDLHAPEPKDVVDKDLSPRPTNGNNGSSQSKPPTNGTPSTGGTRRSDIGRPSKPPVPGGLRNDSVLFP
ncbi:hypothetical protein [Embleya sp. AB8]|uniref:hypothetical protein n=1 Tax=Embleya sp. AB8 TaxID=3156304 RepID=UPI003C7342CA